MFKSNSNSSNFMKFAILCKYYVHISDIKNIYFVYNKIQIGMQIVFYEWTNGGRLKNK